MFVEKSELTKVILEEKDVKTFDDIQTLLYDLESVIPFNHALALDIETALDALYFIDDAFTWGENDYTPTYLIQN